MASETTPRVVLVPVDDEVERVVGVEATILTSGGRAGPAVDEVAPGGERVLDLASTADPAAAPRSPSPSAVRPATPNWKIAEPVGVGDDEADARARRVLARFELDVGSGSARRARARSARSPVASLDPGARALGRPLAASAQVGVLAGVDSASKLSRRYWPADLRRVADVLDMAIADQHRPVAVVPRRVDISWVTSTIVLPACFHLAEGVGALLLEGGVADRQHLVDQEDVGIGLQHQREGEPDQHPRGVVLQLQVDEFLEFGELEDRVQAVRALRCGVRPIITPLRTTFSRAVSSTLKPTPSSMNGASRPAIRIAPSIGPVDAGQQLQQGALARAVAPDDPEELTLADLEGDAVEGLQLAVLACRRRGARSAP